MNAKYYIYRNLNKGGFSVKYRGKVIKIIQNAALSDVEFRVSAAGRKRAMESKVRNVHAYIVCNDEPSDIQQTMLPQGGPEIKYNPFKCGEFVAGIHNIMIRRADTVHLTNGRAYLSGRAYL